MKTETFTALLADMGYAHHEEGGKIAITHEGYVDLNSCTSLPDGVEFNNKGYVDLSSCTSLPDGVGFNNGGRVYLTSCTSLPDGVEFNNGGSVDLNSCTSLPDGVEFNNGGSVDLTSCTSLPDGVEFNNKGYVDLSSCTSLPDGVVFNNGGSVYLGKLDIKTITYRGQKIRLEYIDGCTMVMGSSRKVGEVIIHKARYFGGGDISKLKKCFLANQGDYWAHGGTSREAMEDLRFKVMSENFDKEDVLDQIKDSQRVQVHQYRLLTGACREGCRQFLRQHGYKEDEDSLPLTDVIKLTPGHYGSESALGLLKPLLTH